MMDKFKLHEEAERLSDKYTAYALARMYLNVIEENNGLKAELKKIDDYILDVSFGGVK